MFPFFHEKKKLTNFPRLHDNYSTRGKKRCKIDIAFRNNERDKINKNNNLSQINNGFLDTIAYRIYLWLLPTALLKTRANNKFPIALQTKSLINVIFILFFSSFLFQSSSILFFLQMLFIQHF